MKTEQIEKFISLVNIGINAWSEAGKLLVQIVADDPGVLDEISAKSEWLQKPMLETFIKIGQGKIHPKTLLLPPSVASRVSSLPMPEQAKLVNHPVRHIRKELDRIAPLGKKTLHHETGLADKIPTVGFWKVTVMNGKAFATKTQPTGRAIPVVLDSESSFYLQVLSPNGQRATKSAPVTKHTGTPLEVAYKEFREGIRTESD